MDSMLQVREGMHVIDASGEDIGVVEDLKMGDASADTAEGQTMERDPVLIEEFAHGLVGEEGEMSEEQWQRMLRIGYIKVNGAGLFGGHFYVAADRVDRVDDETVHLAFSRKK